MFFSSRFVLTGYFAGLLLLSALAVAVLQSARVDHQDTQQQISRQLQKIDLVNELAGIVHDRTRFMQSLLLRDRPGAVTGSAAEYETLSGAYRETRSRLLPLLGSRELALLESIDRIDAEIGDLNRQVSVLFLNGSRDEAGKVLLREVLPKTAPLLSQLAELTQGQQLQLQKIMLLERQTAEQSRQRIALISMLAVALSVAVTIVAIWYGRRLSGQLREMNSYLEQKIYERTESLLDTQRELLQDNTELTRLALTDSLTGLSNRTHMNQILHKEFARFKRHDQRFGIIMLDIDNFKQVNDTHGHDVGDATLKKLALILEGGIRENDFVARWGGEEFLFCCTMIDEDGLLTIAETVRHLVSDTLFKSVGRITASLGCAVIIEGESIGELIKRADVALYEAKNSGRNNTVVTDFSDITRP